MKEADYIFVFGSNLAGRHGAGAALYARKHYGAEYGVGVGRTGQAYGIPTKDERLRTLPLDVIDKYIAEFVQYAAANPELNFLLTPIGCGLAGYSREQILPLVMKYQPPSNVIFSPEWNQ